MGAVLPNAPSPGIGGGYVRGVSNCMSHLQPLVPVTGSSPLVPPSVLVGKLRTVSSVGAHGKRAAVAPEWCFQRDGHTLRSSQPYCLELSPGSGRLTLVLRRRGLDALGLDHRGENRLHSSWT